ncbi:MAG: hydrogenase [Alphaproteobacteria bacterium]
MRRHLLESPFRSPLTEAAPPPGQEAPVERAESVGRAGQRRLSIREIDAGSCNGCELEIHALNNAFHDIERFGIRFVASPSPKWVVPCGDCARDGGCFAGSRAVVGVARNVIPVNLHVPGCPPSPGRLPESLLALLASA